MNENYHIPSLPQPLDKFCKNHPLQELSTDTRILLQHFISYHSLEQKSVWWINQTQTDIDDTFKSHLTESYMLKKMYNLLLWNEWMHINSTAKQVDIRLYLYKGLALSYQLYGDATARPTRDLDIFVLEDQLFETDAMLKKLGYERVKPDFELSKKQQRQLKHHIHHFSYVHPEKNVLLELHWQLVVPISLFPMGTYIFNDTLTKISEPFQQYPWEWLLHYLIIHGAMHHWYKLIWLSDIDAILRKNIINMESFQGMASIYHDKRMVNVAFFLTHHIFETPLPLEITLTRKERTIVQFCMNSILNEQNYLKSQGIKRMRRVCYLSSLKKSIQHKVKCWFAISTNADDWQLIPLPDRWFFLYYLLRPFLMVHAYFSKRKTS